MSDTLALVESPAQLLHVLEWCHAEQSAARTRLAVLAPTDQGTVAQLRSMADFAAEEGIETEWFAPRASALAGVRTLVSLRREVATMRRLVIGDPFSGIIQALLPFAKSSEVVVVDDGTATLEFASQLEHGTSLRRWDSTHGTGLLRTPLARNARSFFASGQLRLFTVMTVTSLPGSRIQRHGYDWTRRRFGPPVQLRGLDVIGSSLVETGVVDTEATWTPSRRWRSTPEAVDGTSRTAGRTRTSCVAWHSAAGCGSCVRRCRWRWNCDAGRSPPSWRASPRPWATRCPWCSPASGHGSPSSPCRRP